MAAEWYYTSDRQQMGPVSWTELCQLASSGILKPTDLVWKDGMPDWSRAGTQGLFRGERKAEVGLGIPERGREEETRPRRRRSRMDEEEDDGDFDDEDERPRRRRRPQGMPAGAKVAIIVGGVVVVLLI